MWYGRRARARFLGLGELPIDGFAFCASQPALARAFFGPRFNVSFHLSRKVPSRWRWRGALSTRRDVRAEPKREQLSVGLRWRVLRRQRHGRRGRGPRRWRSCSRTRCRRCAPHVSPSLPRPALTRPRARQLLDERLQPWEVANTEMDERLRAQEAAVAQLARDVEGQLDEERGARRRVREQLTAAEAYVSARRVGAARIDEVYERLEHVGARVDNDFEDDAHHDAMSDEVFGHFAEAGARCAEVRQQMMRECRQRFRDLRVPPLALFQQIDVDRNGRIDREEFIRALRPALGSATEYTGDRQSVLTSAPEQDLRWFFAEVRRKPKQKLLLLLYLGVACPHGLIGGQARPSL